MHHPIFTFLLVVLLLSGRVSAQTAEYEFDSLPVYSKKLDYGGAIKYLEREKNRNTQWSDSARCDWKIVHAKFLIYNGRFDVGLENLKEMEEYCLASGFDLLSQKAKIQIADCYRAIRMVDKAMTEIQNVKKDVVQEDTFLLVKYLHRKAAIFSEHHLISKKVEDLDTSYFYSQQALQLAKQNNYLDAQATCYNELASNKLVPRSLGNAYYDSAIMIWGKIDLANYVHALNNKASYYLEKGNYDSASIYMQLSDTSLRDKDFPFLKVETYRLLSRLKHKQGDSTKGNKFRLLEETARADYWENLAESRLHDLTVEYETKEKDEIISARNKSIREEENRTKLVIFFSIALMGLLAATGVFYFLSRKKNARLNELLKENEFLIGESNHRIKNNLQLIVSLIERELFKEGVENEKLNEISEKIKSIAILHQQLYLKNAKEYVSVQNYLNGIKKNLEASITGKEIKLFVQIEDFSLKIDKAVFLGLLVTELITNSVKHAFHEVDEKSIIINVNSSKGFARVDYSDSGKGSDEKINPSLAMILIKQLKAKHLLNSKDGFNLKMEFEI